MGTTLDVPADLIDVELHGKGVGKRQRQAGTFSFRRADGAEQIGVLVALIGRLPRAGPAFCPEPDNPVLLPDPRFVLKPDLDRLALGEVGDGGGQRPREVFLNAVTVAASWPGWRGRALMCEKPSFLRSVPTWRSWYSTPNRSLITR